MHHLEVTINGRPFEVEISDIPIPDSGKISIRIRPALKDDILGMEFESVPILWKSRCSSELGVTHNPGWYLVNEHSYEVAIDPDLHTIHTRRGTLSCDVRDMAVHYTRPASGDGRVKAPIPGVIAKIFVTLGSEVDIGQPILILEAMKMQNELHSPLSGKVKAIFIHPGESVPLGKVLVEIG